MVSWKGMLELEWEQLFGQRREHAHKPWSMRAGADTRNPSSQSEQGAAVKSLPPVRQVIHDLEAARLRHLMHLARQHPYHGARTNCRWHESRHQPSLERGSRHA